MRAEITIVTSDTNIIYSCFYRPKGAIATILRDDKKKLQFIVSFYLLDEIGECLPEIMERNNLTRKRANKLLKEFTEYITFYSLEEVKKKNRTKAAEIAEDIDSDDYLFIALRSQKGHKIWIYDTKLAEGLKKKDYDICVTAQQLKRKIYKKGIRC